MQVLSSGTGTRQPTSRNTTAIFAHIGEPLVEQLMLDFQIDEMKAAEMFYASSVFTQLADISTQLYQKPWQEIYEMLKKELEIRS
jgi:hypothetical protein